MKPYTTQASYVTEYRTATNPKQSESGRYESDSLIESALHSMLIRLSREVAETRKQVVETQELIKDVIEQMHTVLSALDDLTQ
jgi:hypothetical protein